MWNSNSISHNQPKDFYTLGVDKCSKTPFFHYYFCPLPRPSLFPCKDKVVHVSIRSASGNTISLPTCLQFGYACVCAEARPQEAFLLLVPARPPARAFARSLAHLFVVRDVNHKNKTFAGFSHNDLCCRSTSYHRCCQGCQSTDTKQFSCLYALTPVAKIHSRLVV
jgi:hypothetical protein